jgi:hypothetical protein
LALAGHAVWLVDDENYQRWERLFHVDGIHASPLGTFLQGLCVCHAVYQKMPLTDACLSIGTQQHVAACLTISTRKAPAG